MMLRAPFRRLRECATRLWPDSPLGSSPQAIWTRPTRNFAIFTTPIVTALSVLLSYKALVLFNIYS